MLQPAGAIHDGPGPHAAACLLRPLASDLMTQDAAAGMCTIPPSPAAPLSGMVQHAVPHAWCDMLCHTHGATWCDMLCHTHARHTLPVPHAPTHRMPCAAPMLQAAKAGGGSYAAAAAAQAAAAAARPQAKEQRQREQARAPLQQQQQQPVISGPRAPGAKKQSKEMQALRASLNSNSGRSTPPLCFSRLGLVLPSRTHAACPALVLPISSDYALLHRAAEPTSAESSSCMHAHVPVCSSTHKQTDS